MDEGKKIDKKTILYNILIILFVSILILSSYNIGKNTTANDDYENRFYKEGLADFMMLQLYVFPFNNTDVVTLNYGGMYHEIMYINHSVPCPEFLPHRYLYNFTMNGGYEMTWQEGTN